MDVSVCIATFGDPKWMNLASERAAPSAKTQTHQPREVHLVHGRTLHEARNAVAEESAGEWLCFLDADDELDPGYLEAMAAAHADAPDAGLYAPAVVYVVGGKAAPAKLWPPQPLRTGNFLVIGTLVRRSMFLAVGGFRDWPIYADWCLWQRCERAGATWHLVPDAHYIAHVHSLSRDRALDHNTKRAVHDAIVAANYPEAA